MPESIKASHPQVKASDARVRNAFNLIVTAASTLAMAVMGGFLASIKQVNPTIIVDIDAVALIGFVGAGAPTWLFCRIMLPDVDEALKLDPSKHRMRRRWMIGFTAFTTIGMLISVAVSLKNIHSTGLRQIILGSFCAVIVLSIVAWFSITLFRFLEKDGNSLKDGECEPGELGD